MKKLLSLLILSALSLGLSSCCSMFGWGKSNAGERTETKNVITGYNVITKEVRTGGKNGMVQIVEKKIPRYATVVTKVKTPCPSCTRYYCPKKDCCGTTSESTMKMATAQGATGSPHIGLIPTMRKLAE